MEERQNRVVQLLLLKDQSPSYVELSSSRNLSSLVKIAILLSVKYTCSLRVTVKYYANGPKIDEIREIPCNSNVDLGCFVETWIQENLSDQTVAVIEYNLIRRDRYVGQHAWWGMCLSKVNNKVSSFKKVVG